MVIMGIDPGTAATGYGIVKKKKGRLECLGYGTIETSPSLNPSERLKILSDGVGRLIKRHGPEVLAVESVYFFKNSKTVIAVSQAKGVIMLAGARKKIPVREFTPLQAKTAVTGYGRADKKQMQKMVKTLLNLESVPKPDDAADGLAMAICCARSEKVLTETAKNL